MLIHTIRDCTIIKCKWLEAIKKISVLFLRAPNPLFTAKPVCTMIILAVLSVIFQNFYITDFFHGYIYLPGVYL